MATVSGDRCPDHRISLESAPVWQRKPCVAHEMRNRCPEYRDTLLMVAMATTKSARRLNPGMITKLAVEAMASVLPPRGLSWKARTHGMRNEMRRAKKSDGCSTPGIITLLSAIARFISS